MPLAAFPPVVYQRPWAAGVIQRWWRDLIRRRHAVRVWRRYATIVVWGQRWARHFLAAAHHRRDCAARVIQRYATHPSSFLFFRTKK